jgi:hypothetical protein
VRVFGGVNIPDVDACVAGDWDAGGCQQSIQGYHGEICVSEESVPKHRLRPSEFLFGLAALVHDRKWLLTEYAVIGKEGCDRMYGYEVLVRDSTTRYQENTRCIPFSIVTQDCVCLAHGAENILRTRIIGDIGVVLFAELLVQNMTHGSHLVVALV